MKIVENFNSHVQGIQTPDFCKCIYITVCLLLGHDLDGNSIHKDSQLCWG